MSNIKELIRAEIKRLQDIFVKTAEELETEDEAAVYSMCAVEFGDELLSFLDTLPDESEQPTMGYDEAYLSEKIAKASKSWEGVDVDKFMDKIRGREPVTTCNQLEPVTDCHDLTEAAIDFADYARKALYSKDYAISSIADYYHGCIDGFKAWAEWQKTKMMKDNPIIMPVEDFQALINSHAKRVEADYKEKMIKGAVEGEVENATFGIVYLRKNLVNEGYSTGDKVKIIIVKEDKK